MAKAHNQLITVDGIIIPVTQVGGRGAPHAPENRILRCAVSKIMTQLLWL